MRGRIIGRTRTGRTSRDGKRFGAEGGKRGMGGGGFPESLVPLDSNGFDCLAFLYILRNLASLPMQKLDLGKQIDLKLSVVHRHKMRSDSEIEIFR